MTPVHMAYTEVWPPAWEAAEACGRPFRPWRLEGVKATTDGYVDFLAARWERAVDWTNLEHDVIVTRAQLDNLEACGSAWCAFADHHRGPPTLSLARFRAPFMAAHPWVWEELRFEGRRSIFQPLWQVCDTWLVQRCGLPCLHGPPYAMNTRALAWARS